MLSPERKRHGEASGLGALLAEEQVALAGNTYGYRPGERVGYAAYLSQGVVDTETARP